MDGNAVRVLSIAEQYGSKLASGLVLRSHLSEISDWGPVLRYHPMLALCGRPR
jgi:hypothetical protein